MALRHETAADGWRALRRQLVASGRARGASPEDAEDRAQDAFVRLVREDASAERVPSPRNAGQALKLAEIDELRARGRLKAVPQAEVDSLDDESGRQIVDPSAEANFHRRLYFMDMVADVRSEVGDDVAEMAMKMMAGWTEAEVDANTPSGKPSTGALRKRLRRSLPQLAERLKYP
jgi:DNA-directed RNA polymerase specialized sigma24 family protein